MKKIIIVLLSVYSLSGFSVNTEDVVIKISNLFPYHADAKQNINDYFKDLLSDEKIKLLDRLLNLFVPYLDYSKSEKNKFDEYDDFEVYNLAEGFSKAIDLLLYDNEDYLKMFFEHAKDEISKAVFLWKKDNIEENLDTYRNKIVEIIQQTRQQIIEKYKIFKYNKSKEYYADKIDLLHTPEQSEISVNLMWINKDKKPEVFPENYIRSRKTIDISERICAWAKLGYKVNFWYDSEKLSDPNSNIENTKNKINTTCENHFNDIELKDLRMLNYVNDNKYAFTDKIPVYAQSDLLRVIASLEELRNKNGNHYFMYADLSIDPMSYNDLVTSDPKIIYNLATHGIVMSANGIDYENNFFMVSNKPNMLDAIDLGLIKINLKRINDSLKSRYPYNFSSASAENDQFIFTSYEKMMRLFYVLEGKANWKLGEEKISSDLKPEEYYKWFGADRNSYSSSEFTITDNDLKLQSEREISLIPTKEVLAPPSAHKL